MYKLHCLNKISKVGLDSLPKHYEVTDQLHEAQAILVRSATMHDMTLPKSVVAVARAGAGVNNIPLDAYAKEGVVVFNTPGANANAVKELTICGMLLASRDIYGGMNWIKDNHDDQDIAKTVEKAKSQFAGTEIFGKTVGIIGFGAIGRLLAKACLGLGMKVMVAEKFIDKMNVSEFSDSITFMKDAKDMYPSCDFISINVPLLPDTKGMINKEAIARMKDGVIILNFARDTLVNDQDMEEALHSKKIRKYVTDFPNFKTANMPGVLAIPHLGASTEEAEDNCALMAVDQIVRFIEEGSIINSVNYPNMIVSKEIEHTRLKVLFNCLENTCNQSVEAILNLAEQYTFFQKETKNLVGYMIIDFNHDIDDHMIEKMMNLDYVIRVSKIIKG